MLRLAHIFQGVKEKVWILSAFYAFSTGIDLCTTPNPAAPQSGKRNFWKCNFDIRAGKGRVCAFLLGEGVFGCFETDVDFSPRRCYNGGGIKIYTKRGGIAGGRPARVRRFPWSR
jgi:hypothetical protein